MLPSLRLYFRDRLVLAPIVVVVAVQLLSWWQLLRNIVPTEGQIFLHYNIIFGVDLAGQWWQIFYLPGIALGFFIISLALSFVFYKTDKFFSHLLLFFSVFLQVLLYVGLSLLIELNT